MTLRPEVARERLRKLREVLRNLEEVRAVSLEEFVASFRHHWLAERGLQLAAEAVFDIGNHLLAARFNVHPTDYEDVLRRLAEHGVISRDLRDRLRGLGGFRNILVHEYLDIDQARVYEYLQTRLSDFDLLAGELERFFAREG